MILDLFSQAMEPFTTQTLILIGLVSLGASAIHGATGIAGGFLTAAALAPLIGVKPVVPVVSVALVISHSARALLNLPDFHRTAFFAVTVPAFPFIIIGAVLYGGLSNKTIAILLAAVILCSIPIRRIAERRRLTVGISGLAGAGAVYGGLSGTTIGPGMLLTPFMLGFGLTKEAFVATLAVIALVTNITRLSVFGGTDVLELPLMFLGGLVGLLTIPGNWFGRVLLHRMTRQGHAAFVDALTILGGLNLLWLALQD